MNIKNNLIKGMQFVSEAVDTVNQGAEKLAEKSAKAKEDNEKWAREGIARLEQRRQGNISESDRENKS